MAYRPFPTPNDPTPTCKPGPTYARGRRGFSVCRTLGPWRFHTTAWVATAGACSEAPSGGV